jgi:hypothetical protein
MNLYFDTEFTGLHQNTSLISIGIVDDDNRMFYATFDDYKREQVDDWILENVINNLDLYFNKQTNYISVCCGNTKKITKAILDWLNFYGDADKLEIWSDCLSYDWVLFNELFGGALNIPDNIYYIPFDICTLFKIKNIDPDINREQFSEMENNPNKHNSLFDAIVIKKCYEKLMALP